MSETQEQSAIPIELGNIYFNGFQLRLSNSDINAILTLNNQPSVGVSMSYTTAKTLAVALNEMIDTLEKVTGREIMTTRQVSSGLDEIASQNKSEGKDGKLN
jgi:hypothetical protein